MIVLMYYIPHIVAMQTQAYIATVLQTYPCIVLLLDYVQGTRRGRMTYCYYQGKPIVVRLHACYWQLLLYLTGLLTRSTYILTEQNLHLHLHYLHLHNISISIRTKKLPPTPIIVIVIVICNINIFFAFLNLGPAPFPSYISTFN